MIIIKTFIWYTVYMIIVLYLNITNILSFILTARLTTTIESLLSSTGHFSHDRERTQVRQNVCWKKEKDRIKIQLKRNLKINNLDNQNILFWYIISYDSCEAWTVNLTTSLCSLCKLVHVLEIRMNFKIFYLTKMYIIPDLIQTSLTCTELNWFVSIPLKIVTTLTSTSLISRYKY